MSKHQDEVQTVQELGRALANCHETEIERKRKTKKLQERQAWKKQKPAPRKQCGKDKKRCKQSRRAKTQRRFSRKQLKAFADEMRANMTPAEAKLWRSLKDGVCGCKVNPQRVTLNYIADFYVDAANLVIEVDGGYHDLRKSADWRRDNHMADIHLMTRRFTNHQVFADFDSVMAEITRLVKNRSAVKKELRKKKRRTRNG